LMTGTQKKQFGIPKTSVVKRIGMPAKKITSIIKRNEEARRQAAPRPISMVGAGSQGGMLTGMGTGGDRG
jgi:hypothetical protein